MYNEDTTLKLKNEIYQLGNDINSIRINIIPDYYNTFISEETKKNDNLDNATIELFQDNPNQEIINLVRSIVININQVISAMHYLDNIDNDITVNIDGKEYFMLAQVGYKNSANNNAELKSYKYIFTDGNPGNSGNGTNLTGSSCSMCAYVNCAINLIGIDGVISQFNFQNDFWSPSTNSLNANLIIQMNNCIGRDCLNDIRPNLTYNQFNKDVNTRGKQQSLNIDKISGLEYITNHYFPDTLELKPENYYNLDNQSMNNILNNVHDNKTAIVARIAPNKGVFNTQSGHYVAIVDYNPETNEVLVLDSAVTIDTRDQSNRNGWVPLTEVTSHLNTSGDNLIVLNKIENNNNTIYGVAYEL